MKNTIKGVVFCILLVSLFISTYKVLSWKDTAGDYISSLDTLYEMEENQVDVLFMGSSHCYCSIITADLWEEYGIAGMNLCISGQDIAGTYHTLKEALKTQKPKVVCIEAYGAAFSGYIIEGNLYRNTLPYKPSRNAYDVVEAIGTSQEEKENLWLRWPIVHTRYKELKRNDFGENPYPYLGYKAEFTTNAALPVVWSVGEESLPMDGENEKWFRAIMELAEAEEIELCFFLAPSVEEEEHQKKYNYLKAMAEEGGFPFVNLIQMKNELGLEEATDFVDNNHTNYFGAQKVTAYMGQLLKENYTLPDRRGEAGYERWNEDALARRHEVMNYVLWKTSDLKTYLDLVGTLEDYVVVVATSGDYLAGELDFGENLEWVGIGEDFFEKPGIWVLDSKQPIYISQEADCIYYTELGKDDLAVGSIEGKKTILINRTNYFKYDSSINVVVYDKTLGQVVDAVAFYAPNHYGVIR